MISAILRSKTSRCTLMLQNLNVLINLRPSWLLSPTSSSLSSPSSLSSSQLESKIENISTSKRQFSSKGNPEKNPRNNNETNKIVPRLMYIYNPWKYIQIKMQLMKFKLLWDISFNEREFIRGTKMATVLMTDIIREQKSFEIGKYTTVAGFHQISKDMLVSKNDPRLNLVRFENEHIHRALPIRVFSIKRGGRKHCIIDMIFVAMRNSRDFNVSNESQEIQDSLRKFDTAEKTDVNEMLAPHRILFAEIFTRFYRDYSNKDLEDWSINYYKIVSFDVLSYEPQKKG